MRIVKTHTGKIYVDKDKKLEFLTVGDYGKENNIKASFLGLNKEINGVRHHAVDLADKWVATISTQKGCPMNCQFCDCPKYGFHGNVSREELVYEIETILANERVTHTNRFNVHFARMGEPTFNDAVLPFAEFDLKSLVNRFITADTIHPVVSTMLPKVNANLKSFIMEWCRIKNSVYSGEAGLQFSINSTDQAQRNEQFNGKSSSSSYTCDICGATESGWDISLEEAGMVECVNGHTICNDELLEIPRKELIKKILESGYEKESEEELNGQYDDDSLLDIFWDQADNRYAAPEEFCPICQFIEYSQYDLGKYLEKEYKVSRSDVFAKVKAVNKRRKKLYDSEYVTEVCKQFDLNPVDIVAGLKKRFVTYRAFSDYILR